MGKAYAKAIFILIIVEGSSPNALKLFNIISDCNNPLLSEAVIRNR
jgi:hypothetical protein